MPNAKPKGTRRTSAEGLTYLLARALDAHRHAATARDALQMELDHVRRELAEARKEIEAYKRAPPAIQPVREHSTEFTAAFARWGGL